MPTPWLNPTLTLSKCATASQRGVNPRRDFAPFSSGDAIQIFLPGIRSRPPHTDSVLHKSGVFYCPWMLQKKPEVPHSGAHLWGWGGCQKSTVCQQRRSPRAAGSRAGSGSAGLPRDELGALGGGRTGIKQPLQLCTRNHWDYQNQTVLLFQQHEKKGILCLGREPRHRCLQKENTLFRSWPQCGDSTGFRREGHSQQVPASGRLQSFFSG